MSPIDSHGPAVVGAPTSPLQELLTDTGKLERLDHMTRPEWIKNR